MHAHTNTTVGSDHDLTVTNGIYFYMATEPNINQKLLLLISITDQMTQAYWAKFGGRRDVKRVKHQRKVRDSTENSMMLHLHMGDLRKGKRGWCEVAMQRLPTLIMLLDGAINSLPNNVVYISGFGRKDSGVLDFDAMF